MERKRFVLVVFSLFILSTAFAFAETKKLKTIGRYTFVRIRGIVPTQEVMKILVDRYAGDIKYGFDMAGCGDLYFPFMDQIKTATFEDRTLPVGATFQWMLFRSRGKVKIVENVEWAGKAALEVFVFKVKKDFKHYEFIMPKPCGNIALHKIEEIIPDAVCDLVVTPNKANINDPITVDMSKSQYAKSMEVIVLDKQGTEVASQTLTPESPKWQTKFDKPGEYRFQGKAFNAEGKASTNPCEAKTYINYPPTCKLSISCLPCEDYVGRPITFDASGSTDSDGEIVKAVFEITDHAGNVIDKFEDTEKPFAWEKIFNKPGVYTITAVVYDNDGAVSPATDPCKITFEVTQKRLYYLIEGGPLLAHGTYTSYIFARAGLLYRVVPDRFDFIFSLGGAIPTRGEPWKFFFLANALGNVHMGPVFFGAGFGYSTKEQDTRKSGIDIVGNVGVDIFNTYRTMGSIFYEVRSPLGGDRTFKEHHKFALGFRFLF